MSEYYLGETFADRKKVRTAEDKSADKAEKEAEKEADKAEKEADKTEGKVVDPAAAENKAVAAKRAASK